MARPGPRRWPDIRGSVSHPGKPRRQGRDPLGVRETSRGRTNSGRTAGTRGISEADHRHRPNSARCGRDTGLSVGDAMPKKITYYAMVDDLSSKEEPAGVLRRTEDDEGQQDEAFTRNLEWEYSWSLYSYERGNRDAKFHEI